jgi:hypothetical protein
MDILNRHSTMTAAAAVLGGALCFSAPATAQVSRRATLLPRINAGTRVEIRTSEPIDERSVDGRVYRGVVDRDVLDTDGRLAIPRGSRAELIVRETPDNELVVDLDSVIVDGQRYSVATRGTTVGTSGSTLERGVGTLGANETTGKYVGGGALLGTVIGAIAGGGKGAAIGAAAGAAAGAGAQVITHGQSVRVPEESMLTFRLQRDLTLGVPDRGFDRDGHHYHTD